MSITLSNGVLSELKTSTSGKNLQFGDLVGKIGVAISGSNGGGAGVGSWYFYSDEGTINANPPTANGNAIFTINTGGAVTESFNPNKASGVTYLHFNINDSVGTQYESQFNALTGSGGTISMYQNGNRATYTSTTPGAYTVINSGGKFFVIATGASTQTHVSPTTYTFADPISIVFGS